MGQPHFQDIKCIEASLEKGNCVIHCRDGYSLGLTCIIQYLIGTVRAQYPLNIQECYQVLLVGLEMSLQPEGINITCLKYSLSRRMTWS